MKRFLYNKCRQMNRNLQSNYLSSSVGLGKKLLVWSNKNLCNCNLISGSGTISKYGSVSLLIFNRPSKYKLVDGIVLWFDWKGIFELNIMNSGWIHNNLIYISTNRGVK